MTGSALIAVYARIAAGNNTGETATLQGKRFARFLPATREWFSLRATGNLAPWHQSFDFRAGLPLF